MYMSLYLMKEILVDAQKRGYGAGYFNATNMETIHAYIRAAEDTRSPIIIGSAEDLLRYSDFNWIVPCLLNAARIARVPVAVHLDHAFSFDVIMSALHAGFGSVMYDGSSLSYEENVKNSADIARIAHPMGVDLECELGKVGLADGMIKNTYTDPDDVPDFIEKTGTDFLAVSIGTAHGAYKETPHIEFGLLEQIRSRVSIPLVLHGGSGLSDDDFKNSIRSGIQKVNIYTDVINAAIKTVREECGKNTYADMNLKVEAAMYEAVVKKIRIFGSDNKY
jgi:fructose-bisphosphate aldolase class II